MGRRYGNSRRGFSVQNPQRQVCSVSANQTGNDDRAADATQRNERFRRNYDWSIRLPSNKFKPFGSRKVGPLSIGIYCGIDDGAACGESFNPLPHFHHRRSHEIDDIQSRGSLGYLKAPAPEYVLAVPVIANEDDGFEIRHHRSRDPD